MVGTTGSVGSVGRFSYRDCDVALGDGGGSMLGGGVGAGAIDGSDDAGLDGNDHAGAGWLGGAVERTLALVGIDVRSVLAAAVGIVGVVAGATVVVMGLVCPCPGALDRLRSELVALAARRPESIELPAGREATIDGVVVGRGAAVRPGVVLV